MIVVDDGPFEEFAAFDHVLKGFERDEVVMFAIDLASASVAAGVRDGKSGSGEMFEEFFADGGFAGAGAGGDDDEKALRGRE